MNRRTPAAAAAAAALSLVLAGCGTGGGSGVGLSPTSGQNLVVARAGDVLSLDATDTFDNNSIYVMEQIMEPLFMVSPDGKSVRPWLASGFTMSKDKRTYTIRLRHGVEFSNGRPLTAADVKFSLDQDTRTGSQGWGYINSAIDEVTAVDRSTVRIELKHPWAPLLADLSLFSNGIVPDHYGGKSKSAFYDHPLGTGPFEFDSWRKGQYLRVVRNPHYWQPGKPYLKSVTWQDVSDANTRALQLEGGQIDVDQAPDWSSLSSLKKAPGVAVRLFPSTETDYIAFNEKRAPFNDVHVRRAIASAIDRRSLIRAVLFGNGRAANSLLSPGTPYYDKSADGPTYDLSKAKAELARSSRPKGFATRLLVRSGDPGEAAVAQIMQAELKPIGIRVGIDQLDPTADKQAMMASKYDMAYSLWTMDIPDPDEWTSFAIDPSGGSNAAFTAYGNPAATALNRQAEKATDPAERASLYGRLQQATGQDAFLAYLFYPPYAYATSSKVRGFRVTPLGNAHLEDVRKSD
jgi:peptide/nickel transport system substrate-binding protein